MNDSKQYNSMEEMLKNLNRYVSLNEMEINRNNKILQAILVPLVRKMGEIDKLFDRLYRCMFFGGSYYDGLKVGSPNEYDIDLLLEFPRSAKPKITITTRPSFVHVDLENATGFEKLCAGFWKNYLDTEEVLSWMEGVITRALNNFQIDSSYPGVNLKMKKGGPAFTIILFGHVDGNPVNMSIDLVPCFVFDETKWPKNGFKANPYPSLTDFFIVPKKPKEVLIYASSYWRLSFQDQERCLIEDKNRLKPALRLLKKMRDTLGHDPICSYYLKTIVMWEAFEKDSNFWSSNSLSYVFMHLLKKYKEYLSKQNIPYYWYKKHNLLKGIIDDNLTNIENETDTLNNIKNRISYIIKDIERNLPEKPEVVAKYLLTREEHEDFFGGEVEYEPPETEEVSTVAVCLGLLFYGLEILTDVIRKANASDR